MSCILRIAGKHLEPVDVSRAVKLVPYRVDVTGVEGASETCLHYEVMSSNDQSTQVLLSNIKKYLVKNENDLLNISSVKGVEYKGIDIAFMFKENYASLNIDIDSEIVLILARIGLSLSLSIYKASDG
jgi:hypothetical protein